MYDRIFVDHVNKLPLITKQQLLSGTFSDTEVRVEYLNSKDFQSLAKQLKIMHDLRVSLPLLLFLFVPQKLSMEVVITSIWSMQLNIFLYGCMLEMI